MKIICHRGLWTKHEDQNGMKACLEGMNRFDGIEVDLKNKFGKIVLSHDPLRKNQKAIELESLFEKNRTSFYALNIKEDGLGPELQRLLKLYKVKSYMCFDLSSPEKYRYQKLKLRCFDRYGDQDENFLIRPSGVVIDVFHGANESKFLRKTKGLDPKIPIFIISPELHRREHINFWRKIKNLPQKQIYLCTDFPDEAKKILSSY